MSAASSPVQLILHVGAPKCGSSALQSALSMTPDLVDATGRRLRYSAFWQGRSRGHVLLGRDVSIAAQASAYGYVSWSNIRPGEKDAAIFPALDGLRRTGLRKGYVPIASNEGWLSRPYAFATNLARWGHPPVEVVAFLRPVVDWSNAAFWQWGVWNVPSLDAWLNRGNMPYRFAQDLKIWSQIPNVRLRIAPALPDTVTRFADGQGVDLPMASGRNASSSPALLGLLLRHRHLRPSAHDAATEFVVQRWCPPVPGRKLWSVMARHVHRLRPTMLGTWAGLQDLLPEADLADFETDERWFQEKPYHPEIRAGVSPLNDPEQLAGLHYSLSEGLARLAEAEGAPCPVLPPCPLPGAEIAEWDKVLVAMLDALVAGDARLRARAWRENGLAGLRHRLAKVMADGFEQAQLLVSKSR